MSVLRYREGGRWTPKDQTLWPFRPDSFWNRPVGTEATYEAPTDPKTANLIATTLGGTPQVAWVNHEVFSVPVYLASGDDPLTSVAVSAAPTRTVQIRMPLDAVQAGPPRGPGVFPDEHMVVVEPGRRWADEFWGLFTPGGDPLSREAGDHTRHDLFGDGLGEGGVRMANLPILGGLIRKEELASRHVPHALAVFVDRKALQPGPVWPATSQDSDAATTYVGQNPAGTFCAIPASVNVAGLGLNPYAAAVALAFQRYGGYLVEAASNTLGVYVEVASDPGHVGSVRAGMNTIRANLRVVTNNVATTTPSGGGTPLVDESIVLSTPPTPDVK